MPAYEFPLHAPGVTLPQDNGYLLLSALSRKCPFLHGESKIQIAPLRGTRTPTNKVALDQNSILHIRGIDQEQASQVSSSWISIQGLNVSVGASRVKTLKPSPYLVSRLVILEGSVDVGDFMKSVQSMIPSGVAVTLGKRRGLRLKGQVHLGYPVHLDGLSEEASMRLLSEGMGKHTSMGCGVFYAGSRTVR